MYITETTVFFRKKNKLILKMLKLFHEPICLTLTNNVIPKKTQLILKMLKLFHEPICIILTNNVIPKGLSKIWFIYTRADRQKYMFSKCLLRHDVVRVFVSSLVLVFVRAILSWCP